MSIKHFDLKETIDCFVFYPGKTTCARCGKEMADEQKKIWDKIYPKSQSNLLSFLPGAFN